MHIDELHIQNFRCFKEITFEFSSDNIGVIIGVNGSGKSSVLDCIAALLTKLQDEVIKIESGETFSLLGLRRKGIMAQKQEIENYLTLDDINYEANEAAVSISIEFKTDITTDNYEKISWSINKSIINKDIKNGYNQINNYVNYLYQKLEYNLGYNLPLFVYYKTHRMILDAKSMDLDSTINRYKINQLNAYRGALDSAINNFQDFFIWFREEEDSENEIRLRENDKYRNPNLEVIRKAIEKFLEEFPNSHFSNLRVVRTKSQRNLDFTRSSIPPSLTITKNNQDFKLEQLSDGEKMLLMLVTDLARRLAIANPGLGVEALHGKGIVLIDEIDLHLHPQWQRLVIPGLTRTFPNCQFIVTTHSPQVLSKVKKENVFILENYKLVEITPHTYGKDSNSILYELMDVKARPVEVQEKIDACFALIDEEKIEEAKLKLQELADLLGENDSEIVRARTLIGFLTE
jgi:predicted ATP-binding protein involved in virulence